jgi:hypothetical protein
MAVDYLRRLLKVANKIRQTVVIEARRRSIQSTLTTLKRNFKARLGNIENIARSALGTTGVAACGSEKARGDHRGLRRCRTSRARRRFS